MKTIEEASIEYVKSNFLLETIWAQETQDAFKSGAEFAQQWIPVEEELHNEMECVILKSEYLGIINYDVGFLMRGKFKTKNGKPTHWRHINIK